MSDKLLEMEVFFRNADNGSLTAAALDLGLSAQTAGRYLKALEERLEVTLIVRQTVLSTFRRLGCLS
ncbi:helix-turn-helix domain-containing protein [Herbaspirillum camelliae]|uniref:helix-turn-helix domain-containing protein n=1 Tax=Herbaspirillum camelliae TaxID=1892903 RepID=UPI00094A1597